MFDPNEERKEGGSTNYQEYTLDELFAHQNQRQRFIKLPGRRVKEYTMRSRDLQDSEKTLYMFIDHTDAIHTAQSLEQKRTIRLMLASVTHELKTPTNSIIANVQKLMNNRLTEE